MRLHDWGTLTLDIPIGLNGCNDINVVLSNETKLLIWH